MLRVVLALAIAVSLADSQPVPPPGEGRRLALVIGNQTYREVELDTPSNDARDVAALLGDFGYSVKLHLNLDLVQFRRAVTEFAETVRKGDAVIVYYAGHGVEVGGINFFPPIEFDFRRTLEAEVSQKAVSANNILRQLRDQSPQTLILIMDACRNNPLKGNRGSDTGLAPMNHAAGEYIAYSTSPGSTAADRSLNGRNGLFTGYFLEAARKTELDLEGIFKEVRQRVSQESGGAQLPFSNSGLIGTFRFEAPRAATAAPASRGLVAPTEGTLKSACSGGAAPATEGQFFERAKCVHAAGEWSNVIRHLNEAIRLNSGNAAYYALRADAHSRLRQVPRAKDDYQKAMELDDLEPEYPFALGRLLLTQDDYAAAAEQLTRARGLAPERNDICIRLAEAMDKTGQPRAAQELRQACQQ
jgi:uncharacterized caspase-like protein